MADSFEGGVAITKTSSGLVVDSEGSAAEAAAMAACGPASSYCYPFSVDALGGRVDPGSSTWIELGSDNKMYPLVCNWLAKNGAPGDRCSFGIAANKSAAASCCSRKNGCEVSPGSQTALEIGLGVFRFEHDGVECHALHARTGEPVGTNCGAAVLQSLVLFCPGRGGGQELLLQAFCETRLAESEQTEDATFTIFRWHVRYGYWRRDCVCKARPMESVVLPKVLKDRVVDDVDEFLEEQTKDFYQSHGIPYKRAYLFYGVPGGGKTSLIQALAGEYQRNVCFLQPSHPEMTDDALKSAVQEAPARSIIVLEDIDALFDKQRNKKSTTPLTFSGVLNALDGIGAPSGQIFIMTTNFKEQLDPALIRNGRVDIKVEFEPTCAEQMSEMFQQFYPDAAEGVAAGFAVALQATLAEAGRPAISTAALQAYFIAKRKAPAAAAAAATEDILSALDDVQDAQKVVKPKEDKAPSGSSKASDKAGGGHQSELEPEPEPVDKATGKGNAPIKCDVSSGRVVIHVG
jgi:chaperone BCS1